MDSEVEAREAFPFLKWAGGKRSLVVELRERVPNSIATYYEPFLGGAALFFYLEAEDRFSKAVLGDANDKLVQTYYAIQKDAEEVIRRLRRMPNDEGFYYRTRAKKIGGKPPAEIAAWLIYLNRHCFNGLYRENRKGEFNVPFGNYARTNFDFENLRAVQRALRGDVRLVSGDFERSIARAKRGDFVYADPPYLPRMTKDFTGYTGTGFGLAEHTRLRDALRDAKKRGAKILLSNSDCEPVRSLYAKGFEIEEVRGR